MNPDLEILKVALTSVGDRNKLALVKARADAIRDAMMDDEDIDLTEGQLELLDLHHEWVADVYAALGDDVESGEQSAIEQAIQKLRANEAKEIGDAFAALMKLLAESNYDWKGRLQPIRSPDPYSAEWKDLLNDPSVIAAKHHGYNLILHTGLTPSIIYEATRGLHLLFDRVVDSLEESPQASRRRTPTMAREMFCTLTTGKVVAPIPRELALAEIAGTPEISEDAVEPLCNWISDVVTIQPFLIEGYRYSSNGRGFTKIEEGEYRMPKELIAQWNYHVPQSERQRAGRAANQAMRQFS